MWDLNSAFCTESKTRRGRSGEKANVVITTCRVLFFCGLTRLILAVLCLSTQQRVIQVKILWPIINHWLIRCPSDAPQDCHAFFVSINFFQGTFYELTGSYGKP